jgi:hypothetical protein
MPEKYFEYLLERLNGLLKHIEKRGIARIVGASLFFVCARDYYFSEDIDKVRVVDVFLIDLCHLEYFDDEG